MHRGENNKKTVKSAKSVPKNRESIFDEPHYSHGGINYANSPNQRKLNMNKDIYLKQIRGTGSVE